MYYFIVNPASRSGRGKKYWNKIEPVLKERRIPYEMTFSRRKGHTTELVRSLTRPLTDSSAPLHLVILGGDGTLNEALQGICNYDKTLLHYIPTGSSNDLARDMGISRDPLRCLSSILDDSPEQALEETRIDIGSVHYETAYKAPDGSAQTFCSDRRFSVSCGIGFDAGVCQEAMNSRLKDFFNKLGLGKLTYLGIALKQLIRSGASSALLYIDDGEPIELKNLMFIACMSHCYEGGGFYFCPGADASDGLLDLCCVSNVPKWKVLLVLPTAFKGQHYRFQGVDRYRGSKIRIQTHKPLWVHTDGEVSCCSTDILVTCEKQMLRIRN